MQRNNSIDFVRAIAIIMIVTCHYLLFGGIAGFSKLGGSIAGVGNFLFFAISAILFGLQYDRKGAGAFEGKTFMKKRLLRLFASLWPFLICMLLTYLYVGIEVSPVKIGMNFMGFGWFAKLPNIGHLWFVTMVVFCYIMYVVVAKVHILKKLNRGGVLVNFTYYQSADRNCH